MRSMLKVLMIAGAAGVIGVGVRAEDKAPPELPSCPVMGEPIDFSVSAATDDGPVYFCCPGCIKKFEAYPRKYAAAVTEQRATLAKRPKIQVTCPISGEPIDPKAYFEHDGEKIYACCTRCTAKMEKDFDHYKAALAGSYTYQTKCPVSGGEIDPVSSTVLATGQQVFWCCPKCEKAFMEDPAKFAPKLAAQGINVDVAKLK